MGLIARVLGRETRESIKSSSPYVAEFFGLRSGTAGKVNAADAAGLAIAASCINAISSTLAAMPLSLYRKDDAGSRDVVRDHPLHRCIHDDANAFMSAFEAREMLVVDLLVHGNAYARVRWNGRGQAEALEPISFLNMTVRKGPSGQPQYTSQTTEGRKALLAHEVLHLRYRVGADGIMGQSPIQLARQTFHTALEQASQAYKQAQRAFRPAGVVSIAHAIDAQGKQDILTKIGEKAESTSADGGVLVLDAATKFEPLAFNAKDSQFLDSRKLTNMDICRVFGVPPSVAGITDNSTYSNIYGENAAFVSRCLLPMARRIEAAMNQALLPTGSRQNMFVEHNMDALTRGALADRYGAYSQGIQTGFLTRNEVRAKENLPRLDGADELLQPLNMTTGGSDADLE